MPVTEQEEEVKLKITLTKEELVEMFEKNICGLSNSKALGEDVKHNFIIYDRADRKTSACADIHSIQLIKTIKRRC
tara:strand:- start:908 stop:1135 length:228 start_codon:yes stop_codon:yes gene_type:complete